MIRDSRRRSQPRRLPGIPGRLALAPQFVQVLIIPAVVHRLPEAIVQVSHQLAVVGQLRERAVLEDEVWIILETFKDLAAQNEITSTDPAPREQRLLVE